MALIYTDSNEYIILLTHFTNQYVEQFRIIIKHILYNYSLYLVLLFIASGHPAVEIQTIINSVHTFPLYKLFLVKRSTKILSTFILTQFTTEMEILSTYVQEGLLAFFKINPSHRLLSYHKLSFNIHMCRTHKERLSFSQLIIVCQNRTIDFKVSIQIYYRLDRSIESCRQVSPHGKVCKS